MKRNSIFLAVGSVAALSGCETSYAWYVNHPERKDVIIDGSEVSVIPHGVNKFDAWGGADGMLDSNAATMKKRQIAGIEKITGCKVIEAEWMPGTHTLQTEVNCSNNKSK